MRIKEVTRGYALALLSFVWLEKIDSGVSGL
jgi:hypothetical protein